VCVRECVESGEGVCVCGGRGRRDCARWWEGSVFVISVW